MADESFDDLASDAEGKWAYMPRRTRVRRASRPFSGSTRAARVAARHAWQELLDEEEPSSVKVSVIEEVPTDPPRKGRGKGRGRGRGRGHLKVTRPRSLKRRLLSVAASLVVLVILIGGGLLCFSRVPASITLNGVDFVVGGDNTIADAMRASGIKPKPGDFVAVDGSVLEAGKGEPLYAAVNGRETTDVTTKLVRGDVLELGNGKDTEEPSDVVEESVPGTFKQQGNGPIHLVEGEPAAGLKLIKTGNISGLVAEELVTKPVGGTRYNRSPNVGDERVVALTFNDGPSPEFTGQVLDVLAESGAKATFFTIGQNITGEGEALVQRAAAEGHQICTQSFDCAVDTGQAVDLNLLTAEEQIAEIEQGFSAIEDALGVEASHVVRAPGGNYGDSAMTNVSHLVSAEIGWDVDSLDWQQSESWVIAQQLWDVRPGVIVLLHDGGGDQTQTIEALREVLPTLVDWGYRFVTIDELMTYPLT